MSNLVSSANRIHLIFLLKIDIWKLKILCTDLMYAIMSITFFKVKQDKKYYKYNFWLFLLTWLVVWLNTIIPFDNLYRRAYFVMHTFLVFHVVFFFVFFVFVLSLVPNVACVSRLSILDCPLVFSNVYCVQYGMVEIISCIFCPVLLWKM
jgi:hypothetical protein